MLTFMLPIFAALFCSKVECLRIALSYGKVRNINKVITWLVGVVMFAICLSFSLDYYDNPSFFAVLFYGLYYASVRGVLYDLILNKLRGLSWSYKSETTNSFLDRVYNGRISFWGIRTMYVIISIISTILCLYFPLTHY